MNNLSYIIVLFLFAGMAYVGVEVRDNIKRQKQEVIDDAEALVAAEVAAIQAAIDQRNADNDKFIREINHDSDPSTDFFEVKLTAISADPENDEMLYLWEQVDVSLENPGGSKVDLIDNDKAIAYFKAPQGEYRFQLTVTDKYGDSNMDSQVIRINPEPNKAPSVDIKVESGFEPSNPFNIVHDRDPKSGIFNIKLEANGTEPDGDKFEYKWEQIAVSPLTSIVPVSLSSETNRTTYFKASAGEYRIQLTMTDTYGDSDVTSQLIVIEGEPNEAPSINFQVSEGIKPIDPFDGDVDKIIEFQKEHELDADGKWGNQSQEKWDSMKEKNKDKPKKIIIIK
tara:strand:+ start:223 stop:1239 length:1017 start_codon:yes stop_codon:yes gene_type:complete